MLLEILPDWALIPELLEAVDAFLHDHLGEKWAHRFWPIVLVLAIIALVVRLIVVPLKVAWRKSG